MESNNIGKLYKCYGILADAKEQIAEYGDVYKEILKAAEGTQNERKLVCLFIPRFFSHFPALANDAINAHFDLCEDSDLSIRKQAIKELPSFCRECTEYTRRVSDILAQLLQASEPSELSVVCNSLLSLFKIDPRATLLGIFNQIKNGDDRVREKCIEFIVKKVQQLPLNFFTDDVQDLLVTEIKNVLQDASSDEIPVFFNLLVWTRLGKTTCGRKQILDVIVYQLELEKTSLVNPDDEFFIDRFLAFVKTAKRLFSTEISSNKFLIYFCQEVLPKFNSIPGCDEGSGNALEVLKYLAEISFYVKDLKEQDPLEAIFNLLLEYLPLPAEDEGITHQKLQFSYVECLLSTFHQLLKEQPAYLSSDQNKLKDFRIRLQYFARASQVYVTTLDEIIKKSKEDPTNIDSRIKVMALKTISNIKVLIKDFFHNPPVYKSTIKLSWLSLIKPSQKRKLSMEPTNIEKQPKTGKSFPQKIYQPPNGKYSSNLYAV